VTLLSVVQDVCAVTGVVTPASVFSGIAGNRTMQEMLSLANEMAQRIAYDSREWNMQKKIGVITGDGLTEAWPMPANFKRLLLTAEVWRSTSALQPMLFIPDLDDWIQRRALNRFSAWGEWTFLAGKMNIWPVLPVGNTATFPYLDKNCVALASGGFGDSFQSDGDTFNLDERLLKLGMIWQWKAQKGSPYAEDMGTFGDALMIAMGNDTPAPIMAGRLPVSRAVRLAYPWPVPT
jgi:hypothetical protein